MSSLGVYGLRVGGIPGAARWMQSLPSDAPRLEVRVTPATEGRTPSRVSEREADLRMRNGGRIRARRGEDSVVFSLPGEPTDAELLHPYLAPAAALRWQWDGHEALHAGAIALGERAVLMIGAREAGKSTMLAWLSQVEGVTILADDLAVLNGDGVLAGPRSIDLRPGSSELEGEPVRGGTRVRVDLPPAPLSVPVVGSVVLRWGTTLGMEPVPPRDRIGMLSSERSYYRLDGDPKAILGLAGKPMFTLTRPRETSSLLAAAKALTDRFA
jgi:hypothetical protein